MKLVIITTVPDILPFFQAESESQLHYELKTLALAYVWHAVGLYFV